MATTKTVTNFVVTGERVNDDGSLVLLITLTYSDATTAKREIVVDWARQ